MGNQKTTKWSAVSDGHIMMGAALQDGPVLLVSGRQLKAERLSAGLSLDRVGQNFRRGVTRQMICKIERRPVVSAKTAEDFRRAIRAARKFENLKIHGAP